MDHYQTLGLTPDATQDDVKKAFRRLTKEYHPDRNRERPEWATTHMKRVLEANRVLSNVSLRDAYNLRHGFYRVEMGTGLRGRPSLLRHRREGDSLLAQSERILYDLLGGKEEQAFKNYERLLSTGDFDLGKHLDMRDWVDCTFLLAEQYAKRGKIDTALDLYEKLLHSEAAQRRYAYFMPEVKDRIFRLCTDAAGEAKPREAVRYYLMALEVESQRPRKAFIHKKLAECHLDMGDEETARRHLVIAFQFKPDMKGAAKICRRLSMDPNALAGSQP